MWHLLKDMRKKDKGLAFLAVLLIAGQVFLDLKLPDYTKEITVLISSESNTISDYLLSGGKMLACALGSALLQRLQQISVTMSEEKYSIRYLILGRARSANFLPQA